MSTRVPIGTDRCPIWDTPVRIGTPWFLDGKFYDDLALAEYERVRKPAWEEYERVIQPAWEEYKRVEKAAWNEYKQKRGKIL